MFYLLPVLSVRYYLTYYKDSELSSTVTNTRKQLEILHNSKRREDTEYN